MKITGLMVYYYFVCKRKLWYFSNNIGLEDENEDIKIGKILDEDSYSKENKHVLIDDTINIDFIKNGSVINEVKKSKKIEDASIWQLKYYLYYLKSKGMDKLTGKIDYPLLKKTVDVELNKEDEEELEKIINEIQEILNEQKPPVLVKQNICKKCAYCDLCFA